MLLQLFFSFFLTRPHQSLEKQTSLISLPTLRHLGTHTIPFFNYLISPKETSLNSSNLRPSSLRPTHSDQLPHQTLDSDHADNRLLFVRRDFPDNCPQGILDEQDGRSPLQYFIDNFFGPQEKEEFKVLIRGRRPRIVCIPAEIAHPQGYFFKQLAQGRGEHRRALMIALFGTRNPL